MISQHITYKEATHSTTAVRLGIDNAPTMEQLENMKALAGNVFEPLRAWVGEPIQINSFFRSAELNKAIGGSATSQHCANDYSAAIDIDDTFCKKTNKEMFDWICKNLTFDQCIFEFGTDENPDWVHVSYRRKGVNRMQVLRAYKKGGRTVYKQISVA